ncbi:MAG: oligosaccharide flippase family protein [Gemmatimonadetes bacterium]|nr:oligosaccharide flippase family protein [Gemmatimonadota bacterium]
MSSGPDGATPTATPVGAAALYMAPMVVASILPLITLPIFTRTLSRDEYGQWGIATAFGALVAGIASLGIQIGYERGYFAAKEGDRRQRLLWSVISFSVATQLVGLLVVLAMGSYFAGRLLDRPQLSFMLVIAFGTAAITAIKAPFLTTLRNEGRAREFATFSIDELFLGAALSLVGVLWLKWGVTGMLLGPLVASSTVFLLLGVRFARQTAVGFAAPELREALGISLPLLPRVFIGAFNNQIDRLILGAVGSLGAVGVYTLGMRMAQLVFSWMSALQNVYQPTVYRMLFAKAAPREIGEYLLPFGYASALVALGVTLFSTEIVVVLAPPEYGAASSVLAVLAVNFGLMFFAKQPQLVFAGRTGITSVISIVTLAVTTAGAWLGAVAGGAVGAAVGVLVGGIVTGTLALVVSQRFAPIGYPRAEALAIFGTLPLALALVLLLDASAIPAAGKIIIKATALGGFLLAGWRSGWLSLIRTRVQSRT